MKNIIFYIRFVVFCLLILTLTFCKGALNGGGAVVQQPLVSLILTSQQQQKSLLASEARGDPLQRSFPQTIPVWFQVHWAKICEGVYPVYFDLTQPVTSIQPLIPHDLVSVESCLGAMTEKNLYTIRQNPVVNPQNPSESQIIAFDVNSSALAPAVVYSGEAAEYELPTGNKINILVTVHPPVTRIMDAIEEDAQSFTMAALQGQALQSGQSSSEGGSEGGSDNSNQFQTYQQFGAVDPQISAKPASIIAFFVKTEFDENGTKQKKQGIKVMKLQFSVVGSQRQTKIIEESFISLPDSPDPKNPQWWDTEDSFSSPILAPGHPVLAPGYFAPNAQLIIPTGQRNVYFAVTSKNLAMPDGLTTFYRYGIDSKRTDRMFIVEHKFSQNSFTPQFLTTHFEPLSFSYDYKTYSLIWSNHKGVNAVQTNLMIYDSNDPKNLESNLIENLDKIDFDFTSIKLSQTVNPSDNLVPNDIVYSNEFNKFFGISTMLVRYTMGGAHAASPGPFFDLHDLGDNLSTFPNKIYESSNIRLIHLQTVKK